MYTSSTTSSTFQNLWKVIQPNQDIHQKDLKQPSKKMEASKVSCNLQDTPEIITMKEIRPNPQKIQSNNHKSPQVNHPETIPDMDQPCKQIILEKMDSPITIQTIEIDQPCPPGEEDLSTKAPSKNSSFSPDFQPTENMATNSLNLQLPQKIEETQSNSNTEKPAIPEIDITEAHSPTHSPTQPSTSNENQENVACKSDTKRPAIPEIDITEANSPIHHPIQPSISIQNQVDMEDAEKNALRTENSALKMENHVLRADINNLKEQNKNGNNYFHK